MRDEHEGEPEPKAEVHTMALVREALLCWRYFESSLSSRLLLCLSNVIAAQGPASTRCCLTSFTAELLVGYLEHSHGPKRDITSASLA